MTTGDKVPCKFCRNKYSPFNVTKHEEQCAMNPINGAPRKNADRVVSDQPQETKDDSMKIRDIIVLPESGLAAYFMQEDKSTIAVPVRFVGTIILGPSEAVSLLVVDANGLLQPPSTMEGFVGIFKEDQKEVDKEEPPKQEEEPELPKPERVLLTDEAQSVDIAKQITEIKDGL